MTRFFHLVAQNSRDLCLSLLAVAISIAAFDFLCRLGPVDPRSAWGIGEWTMVLGLLGGFVPALALALIGLAGKRRAGPGPE